jgi:predicted permease
VSARVRSDATPPRLARTLAAARVRVEQREFLLGDLDEDFYEIAATRGVGAARRWYWRQAMRNLLARHPPSDVVPSTRGAVVPHFIQDVRFALRMLRRAPGFACTAILTLALGVGATTAIFSVVDAVLLAPLPFTDAGRLVIARGGATLQNSTPISYPAFLEWRDGAVFEHTGAYFNWSATFSGDGEAEQLQGLRTSASLFDALGVRPMIGMLFTLADEPRTAEPKVLIGEGFWRRRFGGRNDVLGRRMTLNAVSHTIVGVLPASFRLRPTDDPPEIVSPLRLTPQSAPASLNFIGVAARLEPGQTPERARDELQALVRRLHPDVRPAPTVTVVPVRTVIAGDSARVLWPLLGAVGFLLCIGCANLANLLLARATSRRPEIGIRLALGASRSRIVRQLLTESVVLALAGGACGVALAWLAVALAGDLNAVRAAGAYDVRVNLPVLGFALVVSLVSGIFFGLAPALTSGQQSAGAAIGAATRIAAGRSTLRSTLVVIEVALTLVLLVGAALLVRSFVNLILVNKGFNAERVVTFGLTTPGAKYATPESRTRFFQAALAGLAALPQVRAAGLVNELPLGGGGVNGGVNIQGRTFAPGQGPMPEKRIVSPDYFRALGIAILKGRDFTEGDRTGTTPVMVVSESFARTQFAGVDPIGQRVAFNWDMDGFQEVVGVVADVKHYGLDDGPQPMVYVSYLQRNLDGAEIVVGTSGEIEPLFAAARDVIRRLDPDRPLTSLGTLDELVTRSVATRRFALWMVGGFAAIGLVLAGTGIYGVVAYAARQRTREFGIRLALGARSGEVIRLVLRQGLIPVGLGVVIGTAGALALTGLIRAHLFGVEPTDPVTFGFVVLLLGLVGVAACYLPARRANKLNPSAVLRTD